MRSNCDFFSVRAADDGGEIRPDILRDVDISEDKLKQQLKAGGNAEDIKEVRCSYYPFKAHVYV
jgi:hypothetical protein